MKIAYVLNSSTYGGMENHVIDLVEGMIIKGHEVFVWCPPGVITRDFKRVGASLTEKEISLDIDPAYIFKLRKFLKRNEIDIIHAHELKAVVNATIAGYLAGTKVRIGHTHTPISEWQISKLKKKINLFVYPKVINNLATHEIALTESRKKIKIKEGIKEDKLYIVKSPNCIKIEDFIFEKEKRQSYRQEILDRHHLSENQKIWGYLGRLSEEKGHKILVHGFKKFLDQLPSRERVRYHLILTGGGLLEEELNQLASELNIHNKVTITGKVPHVDVPKYYSSYNFFVHPSLAEGFGIVLIEAMATGIPVIASDLEVFKEVASDTVSYFETGDSQNLSEVMLEISQEGQETLDKAKKAQKRVENLYSFERFVEEYNQFYLEQRSK